MVLGPTVELVITEARLISIGRYLLGTTYLYHLPGVFQRIHEMFTSGSILARAAFKVSVRFFTLGDF